MCYLALPGVLEHYSPFVASPRSRRISERVWEIPSIVGADVRRLRIPRGCHVTSLLTSAPTVSSASMRFWLGVLGSPPKSDRWEHSHHSVMSSGNKFLHRTAYIVLVRPGKHHQVWNGFGGHNL